MSRVSFFGSALQRRLQHTTMVREPRSCTEWAGQSPPFLPDLDSDDATRRRINADCPESSAAVPAPSVTRFCLCSVGATPAGASSRGLLHLRERPPLCCAGRAGSSAALEPLGLVVATLRCHSRGPVGEDAAMASSRLPSRRGCRGRRRSRAAAAPAPRRPRCARRRLCRARRPRCRRGTQPC